MSCQQHSLFYLLLNIYIYIYFPIKSTHQILNKTKNRADQRDKSEAISPLS